MQYRQLGSSGLQISTLTLSMMTFGDADNFRKVGDTDLAGAELQIDMCIDAGVNFINTANVYSRGLSDDILRQALRDNGRQQKNAGCN